MTPAIRIIKAPIPSATNLLAVEREEQILAVARRVAEASGYVTQERVDSCAEKLRAAGRVSASKSPDAIATEISRRMLTVEGASALMAHADLDLDRIMALLEG